MATFNFMQQNPILPLIPNVLTIGNNVMNSIITFTTKKQANNINL